MHIWSGTLGLARVFQWNSRVFQCAELSSVAVNIPASVREDVTGPAVLVRLYCTAVFLLIDSQPASGCHIAGAFDPQRVCQMQLT